MLSTVYHQSHIMSSTGGKTPTSNTKTHPTVMTDPPYSIFDTRQKWLIIIIVSTAATCEFCNYTVYYFAH